MSKAFTVNGQDIRIMTRPQLLELRSIVEMEMADIKAQIEAAELQKKTEGIEADPDWWYRVNAARRYKAQELQAIATRLAILNAEQKEQDQARGDTFERTFMNVAKRMLTEDTYEHLIDLTHEEIGQEKSYARNS